MNNLITSYSHRDLTSAFRGLVIASMKGPIKRACLDLLTILPEKDQGLGLVLVQIAAGVRL